MKLIFSVPVSSGAGSKVQSVSVKNDGREESSLEEISRLKFTCPLHSRQLIGERDYFEGEEVQPASYFYRFQRKHLSMAPLIRNIGDTARWVAVYRADETDRPDAVFNDPYARRLAGPLGEQIVQAMQEGRQNSWSFVARTWLFDQFVLQHVQEGYDMIINLASGLDTRPYRLSLPSTLQWVDIDLPEMTDYMRQMMAKEQSHCRLERIPIDLSDREARLEVFHQLSQRATKILVVSEGLVGYLDESEAGALAFDLSHCKGFRRWVLDIMSPGILPLIQQEMGSLLDDAGTPLKFAPEEGEDFFRLFGWKLIESRSKLKTADQLNRLNPELKEFAKLPEPAGPKGNFPWSGVSLFENTMF